MNFHASRHFAVALAFALPAASHAQWVDFAQIDASSDSSTLVLVREAPRNVGNVGEDGKAATPAPLLSATATRWSSGEALAIGYVLRWKIAQDEQQWLVGAGVGANSFRSRVVGNEERESALSARLQSEWFGPALGGSYYALAQASSFRGSWFATLQYSLPSLPLALEASRYHETTYQATTVGLRVAIGVPHWFVRVGAVRADGKSRPFAGVTYNAF